MRKRHHKEHWPQLPSERIDPMQHAKGRTGDCPGPHKETATDEMSHRGAAGPGPWTTSTALVFVRLWSRCHGANSAGKFLCVAGAMCSGRIGGRLCTQCLVRLDVPGPRLKPHSALGNTSILGLGQMRMPLEKMKTTMNCVLVHLCSREVTAFMVLYNAGSSNKMYMQRKFVP